MDWNEVLTWLLKDQNPGAGQPHSGGPHQLYSVLQPQNFKSPLTFEQKIMLFKQQHIDEMLNMLKQNEIDPNRGWAPKPGQLGYDPRKDI